MNYIINGTILLPDGPVAGKALAFEGGRIVGLVDAPPAGADIIDAAGGIVAPGLVDVHIHGFMGWDASNGSLDELRAMSRQLARWGTTAWLPTTMTLPWPTLETCFAAVRAAMAQSDAADWNGARVLGCHAEGPFISAKKKGAQLESAIQRPDLEKLRPWTDVVRLMTVAPEVEGALSFIRGAAALGITLSMGHTDATAAQALAGVEAGVTHATHTFNAMTPLNHREPGVVGAALADDRVYCELIADTFHVDPMLFGLMARQKGEKLVLITDSIQVAHLLDGPHDQSGQTVIVDGIRCRFPDGTIAGSALTLDRAVRNFKKHTGLPLCEVVNMASLYPARSVGVDGCKGSLEPGKDADILIADRDFNVQRTFVGGREIAREE
ncbi:MAG: N-acetylglucosamine-6-phosphate deacetylase [Clostridia bacterium]|nr:N-acetylglucosamine-6-phosphate deacetylase [Clostridia bacterium]